MSANSENSVGDWGDPDEIPDLTGPDWRPVITQAKVLRGRPKSAAPKISTTIRLSPDVIAHFKKDGPGWQRRIDEALRKLAGV